MSRPVSPVDEVEREFVAQTKAEGMGTFDVEIDGEVIGGWRHVDPPVLSTDGVTNRGSGGDTVAEQRGKSGKIRLEMERSVGSENEGYVWNWINDLRRGKVEESRRDVVITLNDADGNPSTRWKFTGCWPKTYEPPDLGVDAGKRTERLALVASAYARREVESICGHDLNEIERTYSRATGGLDGPLRSLVTNATIRGTVAGDEDGQYTIRTDSNGAITTVLDRRPTEPDLVVETDCETLSRIVTAEDPQASLRTAYENDDVRVRGTGIVSGILTGVVDTITTISDVLG